MRLLWLICMMFLPVVSYRPLFYCPLTQQIIGKAASPDGSAKVVQWPPAEQPEEQPAPAVEEVVSDPVAPVEIPQPVAPVVEAPVVAESAPAPAAAAPTVVPVSSVLGYHEEVVQQQQHQQTSANAGFLPSIPAPVPAPSGKGNGGATNSGPRRGKGVMNTHVAGTRIPMCATCNAQIRYLHHLLC